MDIWTRRMVLGGAFATAISAGTPLNARMDLVRPVGAMRLSRRLERALSDGKAIVVERSWDIAFSNRVGGLAIDGEQHAVDVRAPARLESIATIERNRRTDDKFPILIDSDGLIVSAGEAEKKIDVARALQAAEDVIASSNMALGDQRQLSLYLGQIQASANSLLDRLPRDLFFPRGDGFVQRRLVNLPDGSSGEFSVSYSVVAQPVSGVLDRAKRRIVTKVGNTERSSSEHWELTAL